MDKAGGKTALLTSAMIVAGVRLWLQVRGKTTTPFDQWAVAWGATFFFLAVLSEAAPGAAGSLSILIALSTFLTGDGVGVVQDLTSVVKGNETGLAANPFSNPGSNADVSAKSNSVYTEPGITSKQSSSIKPGNDIQGHTLVTN